MKIELKKIKIKDVCDGYENNKEEGVFGYSGKLNIRPKYQREFIYKNDKKIAVIDSIMKKYPLNVMYWAKNNDGAFEVMDGQQRTISFCEYIGNKFSYKHQYFFNLTEEEKNKILDYELMVYVCEGTEKEKLEWFEIINIAGEKLTDQELRNAVYTGEWLTDAKKYFSKTNCNAYNIGNDYLNGTAIRQDYLETALLWISDRDKLVIREYMAKHQKDKNASALWVYFKTVIDWVKTIFPNYKKEMKGVPWGILYNKHKNDQYDPIELETKINKLMEDEDVTKKSGIYSYLITGDEKYLNIRTFSTKQKRETYQKQNGICIKCEKHFEIDEMEADHINPWHSGGKTALDNCQMLCKPCNRKKSGK